MLFYRLVEQAIVTTPVTYREVVGHAISKRSALKELNG
jgi:hypothetical protein